MTGEEVDRLWAEYETCRRRSDGIAEWFLRVIAELREAETKADAAYEKYTHAYDAWRTHQT